MYIGPKSRTERPRKTKIGTEVAHVTRDSDTTFKVKGHQAALLTAVLARQAAAAVGVGTCWPWEIAATLPSARRRKALRRPRGRRGGGISWRPPAYSLLAVIWLLLLGPMCDRCPSCLPTNSVRVLKDVLLHCGLAVVGLLLLRQMCYDV